MKVTVITVCFNAEDCLETAIESVVSQSYSDLEYIIIDGDSKDGTKDILSRHRQSVTRIISEPDGGIYEAMNKGVRFATGDYIAFLNADDYLVDDQVVQDAADFLSCHPSCDFLYGDLNVRYPSGKEITVKTPPPEEILDELVCGCLPHQASFTRSSLFSKIGPFNERYTISSDYEWFLRLASDETTKLCYYPRTMASYYAGGLSSQVERSVPESYTIQNSFPPFQDPYWLRRRIFKYQDFVIKLRQWLAGTEASHDAIRSQYDILMSDHKALQQSYKALEQQLVEAQQALAQAKQRGKNGPFVSSK